MTWLDYLVAYMIIGMAVMGVVFYYAYLAIPPHRDTITEVLMIAATVVIWLACATVWPLCFIYAMFIYKSK